MPIAIKDSKIEITSKKSTKELAKKFTKYLKGGEFIFLFGEMGVGKTTLIKEVLLSMKVVENVSSPTFSIINEYITGQNKIVYHMDLYRIKNISEIEDIGLFEYLESGNLCIIEWGDMIEKLIDLKYDKFIITKQNELRIIEKIK